MLTSVLLGPLMCIQTAKPVFLMSDANIMLGLVHSLALSSYSILILCHSGNLYGPSVESAYHVTVDHGIGHIISCYVQRLLVIITEIDSKLVQ